MKANIGITGENRKAVAEQLSKNKELSTAQQA